MMSEEIVECPICGGNFKQTGIERHVNICLSSKEEKPVTRRRSVDPLNKSIEKTANNSKDKSNFFERRGMKRKSIETKINESKKVCNTERLPTLPVLDQKKETIKPSAETNPVTPFQKELFDMANQNKNEKENNDILVPAKDVKEMNRASKLIKTKVQSADQETDLVDESTVEKTTVKGSKISSQKFVSREIISSDDDSLDLTSTKTDITKAKTEKKNEACKSKDRSCIIKLELGSKPLAEQMRPTTLDEYYGQKSVNTQQILKDLFNTNRIPSMLLWGPPGCGKTSLAHVISHICKKGSLYRFVTLSATMSGVNDVKEAVRVAKNEKKLTKRKTVLFIDEVHRFNKLQQDSFLPHVEDGTLILIGATTENPSFHVNNALLSRCRLVVLEKLDSKSINRILQTAVLRLGGVEIEDDNTEDTLDYRFTLECGICDLLTNYCGGDARIALNSLDMILQSKLTNDNTENKPYITCKQIQEEMRSNFVSYDKNGDEHFWMASALQKSIRGSNVDASLYWLARMLEGGETPLYIARRLVRCASEDIGLADSNALIQAISAFQACHFIGMPECDVVLAQAAIYLAQAPKSFSVYQAYNDVKETIRNWSGPQPNVPFHLRNAPTKLLKGLGYGKGYKYNPTDSTQQEYLPKELQGRTFFDKGSKKT